jgi:hypothetical protein
MWFLIVDVTMNKYDQVECLRFDSINKILEIDGGLKFDLMLILNLFFNLTMYYTSNQYN